MKKLLATAVLSLLALGWQSGTASAWFFRGCCHSCCKSSMTICCRPYNAFTPFCFGNFNCTGCCPFNMFGGCQQPCCPPCGGPSCGESSCCDAGCPDAGASWGGGCLPGPGSPISMPAGAGPAGSPAILPGFQGPVPSPLPAGASTSQMAPAQQNPYANRQWAGYRAPYYPGYNYGYPMQAGYGYGYPMQAGYGYGYPMQAGYGYGYPAQGGYNYGYGMNQGYAMNQGYGMSQGYGMNQGSGTNQANGMSGAVTAGYTPMMWGGR